MKEQYKEIVYNWVAKNFGESEAEDPSWSIEALADELAKNAYMVYSAMEKTWLSEDVEYVAENMGIDLSGDEVKKVVNYVIESDAYGSLDAENIEWQINKVKKGK